VSADRKTLLREAADHVLAAAAFERLAERVWIAPLGEVDEHLKQLDARTVTLRRNANGLMVIEAFVATKETPYARGGGNSIEEALASLLVDAAHVRREEAEVCKARAAHAA
jgi:hypothetical protein